MTKSNWRDELYLDEVAGTVGKTVTRKIVRQGIKVGGKRGGRAAQGAVAAGKTATQHAMQKKEAGRGEKIGKVVGGVAGGIAGGALGTPLGGVGAIGTGIAGGEVGERVGGAIGKKFDKKKVGITTAVKKEETLLYDIVHDYIISENFASNTEGANKVMLKLSDELMQEIYERTMTASEKRKDTMLKKKYDDSDMKKNMQAQYGKEEGKKVYFATIRKQAMKKEEVESVEEKIKYDKSGSSMDYFLGSDPKKTEYYKKNAKKKTKKEEVEVVNEVSSKTLRNYIIKGTKDVAKRASDPDSDSGPKYGKKMSRIDGVSKAADKLAKKASSDARMKEEVIPEAKVDTGKSDAAKTNERNQRTFGNRRNSKGGMTHTDDTEARRYNTVKGRGVKMKGKKDKTPVNYHKRDSDKRVDALLKSMKEAVYKGPDKEDRKVINKMYDKKGNKTDFAKKAAEYEKNMDPKKRQALKDKATKGMKFTHEEVEVVNELSKSTLLGYVQKGTRDIAVRSNDASIKGMAGKRKEADKGYEKVAKRVAGVNKAAGKLATEEVGITTHSMMMKDKAKKEAMLRMKERDAVAKKLRKEERDEYGDPVGGPKISKKEKEKNLKKNTPDEQHTTTTSEGYGSDRVGPALTMARVIDKVNPRPKPTSKRTRVSRALKLASIKKDEKIRKRQENPYSADKKLKMVATSIRDRVKRKVKSMAANEDYIPEEGYDIARDMGRVRPSKDKKDGTTMPPSKEMMKTQKVYKGPSALEIVKKKYGKAVMDLKKK